MAAYLCIPLCSLQFKWDKFHGAVHKKVEVALFEHRIPRFSWLCQCLSESKVAGQQFVSAGQHPLPELNHPPRPFDVVLKQVDKEIGVPKDPGHRVTRPARECARPSTTRTSMHNPSGP